jgi:hypothetical protein
MYTANQIISEIKIEKSKKASALLNINTVMNVASMLLGCPDDKKELIRNIHRQSSDEDLISLYFAIPLVISSMPDKRMQGIWDIIRREIETIIPEIKSFQSESTQRKSMKVLSMRPALISDDEFLSLDIDAALAFVCFQLKFVNIDRDNAERYWSFRAALAANRQLTKALN